MDTDAPIFVEGQKVAIRTILGWHGHDVRLTSIQRVTKTQYVTADGRRFRRKDRREVGGGSTYRPADLLIAADDPAVAEAERKKARLPLVIAVRNAYDDWSRDRDQSAPVDLVKAAQELIDFDGSEL